ncbi:hypothetical protein TWF481_008293 [Arthrobotrys musiformis]|uniref:Uncharacterized protein n=1 Tax=Arthrobotrys musiformis TaxID=47236 RepID=A0AAV9W8J8_9PEZI
MAPTYTLAMSQSLLRRGVQDDLATLPETLGNWDKCMEKSWCKYPLIAGCVVGALVLVSVIWCCYRCCCRSRRKKADRSKSTFFNDPVPSYMSHPPARPAPSGYSSSNTIGPNTSTPAPQYAYFESGTTGAKDNDALPVMPSWNGAKNEKVEDTSVKVEAIELEDVSSSSTPPPANSRLNNSNMDSSNNYHQSNSRPNFQSQQQQPQNLNPFGPQRLNNPFGPQSTNGPPAFPPPRTQSPYPESHTMPTATIPPPITNPHYNASQGLDDFDFNPHINAQNQGPYANAEVYPPEPSYQHQQTGVTQPQQPPQFTGTTSPPPPFQHQTFTGATISGETHAYTPTPPPQALLTTQHTGMSLPSHPTSPTPPPPSFNTSGTTANGFNPANNPPPQPTQAIPLPQNSSGGFVAQMDDDFGHSPVHLTNTHSPNNNNNNNAPGGGFNHNDFDHGGYNAYNPNNNYQPQQYQQQQQHGQPGWSAF